MAAEEDVFVVLRLMCLLSLTQARAAAAGLPADPTLTVPAVCACWWQRGGERGAPLHGLAAALLSP